MYYLFIKKGEGKHIFNNLKKEIYPNVAVGNKFRFRFREKMKAMNIMNKWKVQIVFGCNWKIKHIGHRMSFLQVLKSM